ncbi:MAG: hypothetical protein ACP5PX_02945 [Candidatus Hadarchaeum sp.]|uniref:hypothetical protein n=1 Tax=Candidatus Hadarchaeum sp. TaxID=2883567 RepID=UPI003D12F736
MFEIIWQPVIVTVAILLCSLAVYGLMAAGQRTTKPQPTPEKMKSYACGEELKPEEIHADSAQFFSAVRRVLSPFYRYVQAAHTGEVNTYLLWIVAGLVVILIVILLTVW